MTSTLFTALTVYKVNVLYILMYMQTIRNKKQNCYGEPQRFLWAIEMRLYDN